MIRLTPDELYAVILTIDPRASRDGDTLSAGGSLDLGSLTSLPEGVTLSAGGWLYLGSLTSLPEGVTLSAGGSLYLCSLTSLPEGVTLSAGSYLDLCSLTSLPEGVTLSAGVYLDLRSLTSLPAGVTLSAGGGLYLSSLTSLPAGVTLSAGGGLYLGSLTSLPEGVTLSAGGSLDLGSLTSLPEGVTLSAGGGLYLSSLTSPCQRYQGRDVYIENVDGYTMERLTTPRDIGGVTVYRSQYFRGNGTGKKCYIARLGEYAAHGDSVATAISDVRFKQMQESFDCDELASAIRERGVITFNEYRLLTGACESGLRHALESFGMAGDTESLPLSRVIELSKGQYGEDAISELFE